MIRDILKYSISNIWHRRLRSSLTILSILIGITAIFALVSFGQGIEKYMEDFEKRKSSNHKKKRRFMSYEITLNKKKKIPVNKPAIINNATSIIRDIIFNCLEDQDYFIFYKTKN